MGKCRYDLSKDCSNTDCLNCVLDKIIDEIENTEIKGYIRDVECYNAGINFVLHIIAKYKAESEG